MMNSILFNRFRPAVPFLVDRIVALIYDTYYNGKN